jgi:hypothetical protein
MEALLSRNNESLSAVGHGDIQVSFMLDCRDVLYASSATGTAACRAGGGTLTIRD